MKLTSRIHTFAIFSCMAALTSAAFSAAVPFAAGDIGIVFYQYTGSTPTGLDGDTYVLNLGSGKLYRENTVNNIPLDQVPDNGALVNPLVTSNIGADLVAAFGPDWATDGTVRWFAFGGLHVNPDVLTNGDPTRTAYYSQSRPSLLGSNTGPGSTAPVTSSSDQGTLTTRILQLRNGVNSPTGFTSGANSRGMIIPITALNTADELLPPTVNTYFGIGIDPRQTFQAGLIPDSSSIEGALDLYRILNTTTNADLTAGNSSTPATQYNGQFLGTITINGDGDLRIARIAEQSGNYATFAAANGLTGGANGDSDNDGTRNLTEYALNTNLTGNDGSVGTFNGTILSFDKRAAAVSNGDLTYSIEVSDDLGITDPWAPLAGVVNSSTTISGSLPSQNRAFARLKVTTTAVAP